MLRWLGLAVLVLETLLRGLEVLQKVAQEWEEGKD